MMMNYFQHSSPLIIKQIQVGRFVVLTKYRIVYMRDQLLIKTKQIDSRIQAHIPLIASTLLVQENPLYIQHSSIRNQQIVITESSIQIYSCNFISQQIELKKCIILNQQSIFSIKHSLYEQRQWQVYGQIYQYGNRFVKIHPIQSKSQQQQQIIVGGCFVEQYEIYLKRSNLSQLLLSVYDHDKETQSKINLEKYASNTQMMKQITQCIKKKISQQKQHNHSSRIISLKAHKLYLSNRIFSSQQQQQNYLQQQSNNNQCKSQLLASPKYSASCKMDYIHKHNNNHRRQLSYSLLNSQQNNNYQKESIFRQLNQLQYIILLEIDDKYLFTIMPPVNQYNSSRVEHNHSNILNNINTNNINRIKQSLTSSINSNNQNNKWQLINIPLFTHTKLSPKNIHSSQQQQAILFSQLLSISKQLSRASYCVLTKSSSSIQLQSTQIKQQYKTQTQIIYFFHMLRLNNRSSSSITKQNNNNITSQNNNIINIFPNNNLLSLQTYQLQLSQQPLLPSNDYFSSVSSKQFIQLLSKNQQKHKNNNRQPSLSLSKSSTIQLISIQPIIINTNNEPQQQQQRQQINKLQLTFLFYNPITKSKTLSYTKIIANQVITKQQHHKQKDVNKKNQTICDNYNKNITTTIVSGSVYGNDKLNNNSKPKQFLKENNNNQSQILLQKVPLTISQSITQSRPISHSQPYSIGLTYSLSGDTQLTHTDLLSPKPSLQSDNSQKTQPILSIKSCNNLKQNQEKDNWHEYFLSQNKTQQNSLRFNRIENNGQQQQFHKSHDNNPIDRLNELRLIAHLSPDHTPIPQLSQQQYNQQTTKFQQQEIQQIQQIVQMKDFQPTTFSNNKILSSSNINTKKPQPLQLQSQNQTQQKQFYQKFINHIVVNNNDDSQQSFDRNYFKVSKVSVQDVMKKDVMSKMIGGKDISQIGINVKNYSLVNTEEEMSQSLATVELGEEIEKRYSIINEELKRSSNDDDDSVKKSSQNNSIKRSQQQKHSQNIEKNTQGYGLFSNKLQNSIVQSDQPTVILVDNLQSHQASYQQNHNTHQQQQQMPTDYNDTSYPNTPGFNIDFHTIDHQHILKNPQINIISNDHWDNFTKKWAVKQSQQFNQNDQLQNAMNNSPVQIQISLNDEQFIRQSKKNNIISKSQLHKLSKKVKSFCSNPQHLTYEQTQQIENKKYTQLMKQVFMKSQQKFNQLMKEFLQQIIHQQEARLFFAEYIRSFSGKTRDLLVRLYMSLPESQQNKFYMSRALSEFKLSQVPQICLPIHKDILQIFKFLYPSVYVQDLLKPSIVLLQQLMQNYFHLQKLSVDQITIQDELIDLSHPRNMLNVLLYLNDHYNLSMPQLFQTYCSVLIKNDCSQIIVKMLKQQKTFEICQVPKFILQDIVQATIIEKLKQSPSNIQWLQKGLEIYDCNLSPMSIQKKEKLSIILYTIDYLSLRDCQCNVESLFMLSELKNLFIFCNNFIKQNSFQNLKKISLQKLYKQLYQIAHQQKIIHYNQQLKDLLEILSQKYFLNGQFSKGFQTLAPIISISRRGFLAKMLFKYLNGKWMNRLAKKEFETTQEFIFTFKQCFISQQNVSMTLRSSQQSSHQKSISQQQRSIISLPHDTFSFQPSQSYFTKNCSYFKFISIFNQCIKSTNSQEVIYVCYTDYQLAQQLSTYHVITKKQWQSFNEKLQPYIPKEEIKKLSLKNNFLFNYKLPISDQLLNCQQENHLLLSHSQNLKDPTAFLNPAPQQKSQQNLIKSLQSIKNQQASSSKRSNKLNVLRSKSHSKQADENSKDIEHNPLLESLKYEVNPQTITQILKRLYQEEEFNGNGKQKTRNFLKALSMIDRQRVHIHHYEKFKLIANMELDFRFEEFIPFEVLLQHNHHKCWLILQENGLRNKLQLQNFWAVYMIVEVLISQGENVALLMIQKVRVQQKSKNVQIIIQKIIQGTKLDPDKIINK